MVYDSPMSQTTNAPHIPVLLAEVLEALHPRPGKLYVDCTVGAGGHALALLQAAGADSRLIGLDQDPAALAIARERLAGGSTELVQANFSVLPGVLHRLQIDRIDGGVLADLGVSSMQLDTAARGFSFSKDAPLDMRMSPQAPQTAADLVNRLPEGELVRIFSEYGEEHMSKTIAREIVARRAQAPFETTLDLAGLISELYRKKGKREEIHPATRVFQALRIAVNDELGHLRRFLEALPDLLAPGARIAVISFHSLEDRIVKQFFQAEARDCICPPRFPVCQCGHRARLKILTRKPVTAGPQECRQNPRARSARLRCAERL